jgi:tetratricopeptide (TPR) repeat protein
MRTPQIYGDHRNMLKLIVAVICMVVSGTSLQAAGTTELKAAQAAAEKGAIDEAIQLFTQALAGGLSADERFVALRARGQEYSAKSLIADAFNRRDDGRLLRDNAIADLSAALILKTDDASLLVERGQDYHLNERFDPAVADFSTALKLKPSPATLVLRASSYRAKGAYNEAIADCTAALAGEVQDASLDIWDIYNERGYAEFLAASYAAAAADFDKALELGASSRVDDVLWLPYQLAWLHIAYARAGHNDGQELSAFFLGETRLEDVSPASTHGTMGRSRECNLSLFAGEDALGKGNIELGQKLVLRAREVCGNHTLQYLVAGAELDRMKK